MSKIQPSMELSEKLGSNVTLSNGILGEMSSRLEILHCENGRSDGKPMKKQYDRTGHEAAHSSHPQPDHPTSYVFPVAIIKRPFEMKCRLQKLLVSFKKRIVQFASGWFHFPYFLNIIHPWTLHYFADSAKHWCICCEAISAPVFLEWATPFEMVALYLHRFWPFSLVWFPFIANTRW